MDTLQKQIEKVHNIAKRKYLSVYQSYFGAEELFSDVNYIFATQINKIKGKVAELAPDGSENLVNFVLCTLDSYIKDRLRREGPNFRNGEVRYVAHSDDDVINLRDDSYKATQLLTVIKVRAEKLDKQYLQILRLHMEGRTNKEIAAEIGSCEGNVQLWRTKMLHYLRTGKKMPSFPKGELRMIYGVKRRMDTFKCDICGNQFEAIIAAQKMKKLHICSNNCRYAYLKKINLGECH